MQEEKKDLTLACCVSDDFGSTDNVALVVVSLSGRDSSQHHRHNRTHPSLGYERYPEELRDLVMKDLQRIMTDSRNALY